MAAQAFGSLEANSTIEETAGGAPGQDIDWANLVARIQRNDDSAMEDLYKVFMRGIRFLIWRQLGPTDIEDRVHDAFLIVVQAIQRGELREPERLMGFVRTVIRRQIAAQIDRNVQSRRDRVDLEVGLRIADFRQNPEEEAMIRQRTDVMAKALKGLSGRDREILTRFYLYEESQEQICEEMELTETQFRLLKSRAKARFGDAGRKGLIRAALSGFSMRKSADSST